MTTPCGQLISYIAPSAPATRRPAAGREPRLRPEIGFTPNWYRAVLGANIESGTPEEQVRALLELCEEFSRT